MKLKQTTYLVLISYFIPLSYCILSQFWVDHGGASSTLNLFELPFVTALCLIFYFSPEDNTKTISIYSFTPSMTILGIYSIYDVFYSYLARSPRISDFKNIFLIYKVSPFLFLLLCGYIILIFSPTIFSYLAWIKSSDNPNSFKIILSKTCILFLLGTMVFSEKAYALQTSHLHFVEWSDTRNVIKNGRLVSFIYYNNKRNKILSELSHHKHISISESFYAKRPKRTPNIHIIVLESFIDPRKIQGLSFNRSPLSETLAPFLREQKYFSTLEAPVYGGGSPQTKFEILTGIPALALIDSIEYNLFEGSPTSSFVNALKEAGYYTIASNGAKSGFYNSKLAYTGIGFDKLYYLNKNDYYSISANDDYIFDGDFLTANTTFLKNIAANKNTAKPILNYIIGMYGHLPFKRNKQDRPDIITTNSDNPLLTDLANQFYYRTKALGQHLNRLKQSDPEAIIFIASDHLPPILNKKNRYTLDKKINIALLLDKFNPVDISQKKYYEISHIIWSLLNNSSNPVQQKTAPNSINKKDIYFSFISEAMGMKKAL